MEKSYRRVYRSQDSYVSIKSEKLSTLDPPTGLDREIVRTTHKDKWKSPYAGLSHSADVKHPTSRKLWDRGRVRTHDQIFGSDHQKANIKKLRSTVSEPVTSDSISVTLVSLFEQIVTSSPHLDTDQNHDSWKSEGNGSPQGAEEGGG